MNSTRSLAVAVSLVASGQIAFAQDMSRYRVYVLESSVDTVAAASGAQAADAKTRHERPALIQELQWRAPYLTAAATPADPVREIAFTFYDDALYQVVVSYDRDRTEGLTSGDVIDVLAATYGAPTLPSAGARMSPPAETVSDSIVLARWESAESSVTLVRGAYAPGFQLVLVSKPLSVRAREAIRQADRLDAIEAPRRESEQRRKDADEASTARDRARRANKAAFRP